MIIKNIRECWKPSVQLSLNIILNKDLVIRKFPVFLLKSVVSSVMDVAKLKEK